MFISKERGNNLVLKLYTRIDKDRNYESLRKYLNSVSSPREDISGPAEKSVQYLIDCDSDRCVTDKQNKQQIQYLLKQIYLTLGDYDQSLCYLATFFSCFVEKNRVVSLIVKVTEIMGRNIYTRSLVGIQQDIYTVRELISPEARNMMNSKGVFFTCFIKKFAQTLCVNILSDEYIIVFMMRFFMEKDFLYKAVVTMIDEVFSEKNGHLCCEKLLDMILKPDQKLQKMMVTTYIVLKDDAENLRELADILALGDYVILEGEEVFQDEIIFT